jgi:phosphoribosylformylglycinamidine synthase
MPTNVYVSAPLRGKPYGVITTLAFNPFYGEIDPAGMARLMIIEAITKAVAAGADCRQMVLCDNFYTPRVRPEIAWDLRQMVETIADMSVALGIPFISGKDSSSGTFETEGRRIDVPATLVVTAMGRLSDVRKAVSKDFKRPGNRLVLVGRFDCEALGGSVYADSCGQRGERLFDAYDPSSILSVWDALLGLHGQDGYVSASAIAEGGILLRLFESTWGSGYGARISLDAFPEGRKDGSIFGEFAGSVLLEVPSEYNLSGQLGDVPYRVIGEVLRDPQLILLDRGKVVWQETTVALGEVWSKTFREVIE